jgi:hypothetical protein
MIYYAGFERINGNGYGLDEDGILYKLSPENLSIRVHNVVIDLNRNGKSNSMIGGIIR